MTKHRPLPNSSLRRRRLLGIENAILALGLLLGFAHVELARADARALLQITPTGGIEASTYGTGQLRITNTSTTARTIQRVTIDLRTSIFPDMVYDPNGIAGDVTAKCLTADLGAATVGFVTPADPCTTPFTFPHDDGYDVMELQFTDFGVDEEFRFSIDVDPTSIRGASGAGGAGSVSGAELSGATLTVEFDGGEIHTANLFRALGSLSNGINTVRADAPAAPVIEALGLTPPTNVSSPSQTIRITGLAGAAVRLLQIEGDVDLNGTAGFDLDPFEANTAAAITEYSATVGGAGSVDVPVTLTLATGSAGINLLQAVVVDPDGSGRTGAISNTLILVLDTNCATNADCVDGNPCTSDVCGVNGCSNPVANGVACDDGITCTANDVCNAGACAGTSNCPQGQACNPSTELCESPSISFTKDTLEGATLVNPTSLQFGPDNRLYVAQQSGLIKSFAITRTSPGQYVASDVEVIDLIQQIPNHDDNGTPNPAETERLITGIVVAGTPTNPVIYANSGDPRIGGGSTGEDKNLDTNSGIVSRLTWDGAQWNKLDLVRGLPRSEENHTGNGMVLNAQAGVLYLAYGGNTNRGAPSNNFALLPETALSAAILSIDLLAIGETTYDLPTLDDEDRPGAADANDPFGGNNAKNQGMLVPGGPVQVYAPGFRNPYDLAVAQSGKMYIVDNGSNAGWGDIPVGNGTPNCTNEVHEPGITYPDTLHYVSGPGYYGGHPNPTRANPSNTFNASNPQSPVSVGNPIECTFTVDTAAGKLTTFPASTNGLAEYAASNFAGQMQGNLILAGWNNKVWRVKLNAAGTAATSTQTLLANVGSKPLDVIAQSDSQIFPGSIWVADHEDNVVYVYEPADAGFCTGNDSALLDEDGDGYDNADEIDNATNPCSPGDVPLDSDGDFTSNLNDNDDDNDGLLDNADPFARDAQNGKTTNFPFAFTWENDAVPPGGILELGFTGLMTNGIADYESLFNENDMTTGGAAGVVTVDTANEGDALGIFNDQEYAFQVGVNVPGDASVFTVHTRVIGPFLGTTPQDFQSMGLFIGDGGQDDYFKLVVTANGGGGGIQAVQEIAGLVTSGTPAAVAMPGPGAVDLYLTIDPVASTVQPAFTVSEEGVTGPIQLLGAPTPIPSAWLDDPSFGLAAGIISTSRGAAPEFAATWDEFGVFGGPAACVTNADCDDENSCTTDTCSDGNCSHVVFGDGTTCNDGFPCTTGDTCSAGLCIGNEQCPPNKTCVFPAGTCAAPPGDPDNDGLSGTGDPCPFEARNLCAGPVAVDQTSGKNIRLNANVSGTECTGQKTDCNGDVWLADFGYNKTQSASTCNLGGGAENCVISGISAIFGCDSESTEDLFQCEHYDTTANPNQIYTFAVPNGQYVVNLFFGNTFTGTPDVGDRVFDIKIEDNLVYDNFDQVLAAGGSGIAVVRSAVVTVADGNLKIEFTHVTENPSVKAIEALSYVPITTTTSSTTTTTTPTTTSTLPPECFQNADCADSEPCTADECNAGQCDNPPSNGAGCDDGLFCNGADTCFGGTCASHAGDPCSGPDGDGNCAESCDEAADACSAPDPQGSACDDGLFCNGADICDSGSCTSHAGDPCEGAPCDEDVDACETCVSLTLPAAIQCYTQRDCSVPVTLDTGGLPIVDVGATFTATSGFDCDDACAVGIAASNGECSIVAATCDFSVADTVSPFTAFADGEAATLTVRCTEPATSQACLVGASATQADLAPAPSCGDDCVSFACGTCLSGDCNGTGTLDAGDPICTVLCLLGQAPAGADCSCAADCNCLQGTEASDPICTVRRLIDNFAPDTCFAPSGFVAMTSDTPQFSLTIGASRPLADASGFRVPLRLRGADAGAVGSLYAQLTSDSAIPRVRLVRRLRNAGFTLTVGRSDNRHVAVVILPPFATADIPPIDGGRIARVTLRGHSPVLGVGQLQFGSTSGLPLRPAS